MKTLGQVAYEAAGMEGEGELAMSGFATQASAMKRAEDGVIEMHAAMLWLLGFDLADMVIARGKVFEWDRLLVGRLVACRWRWVVDGYTLRLETEWIGGLERGQFGDE